MLALSSGAAVGGLAGCGGSGSDETPVESPTPRVETRVVTKEGSTKTVVKTVKVTEEETPTPEPELKEAEMDVTMGTLPTEVSLNGFHPDSSATLGQRLNSNTGVRTFTGKVNNVAWKSREWDPENRVWTLNFKEDWLTWWNGSTYDAKDWWVGQVVNHIMFGDGSYWEKEPELVDDYTVKCFPPIKRDEIIMATRYAQYTRQPYEEWEPFLEALRDASTQEEIDRIYSEEVQTYERRLQDTVIPNGYGTGPYYPTTVNEQEIVLTRRDLVDDVPDHPFNEKQNIPKWRLNVVGGQSAREQMISNDQIDMGNGPLPARFRDITPRYIQTLDKVARPFGHNLQFNFKNKHLSNVWVRRAIAAAVNKENVILNAGADGQVVSPESGMPATLDTAFLGEEFAGQLYNYPDSTDMEKVDEWMQKAGYSRNSDGMWEDPDGEVPNFTMKGPGGWAPQQQTIITQLQEAGFKGEVLSSGWGTFATEVRENYNYDLTTFPWGCWGQIAHPSCFYRGDKHLNVNYGYKPAEVQNLLDEGKTRSDLNDKPIIADVPSEPGALEISGSGEEVNMLEVNRNLQAGEEMEKNARLGARFVNYYLTHLPIWTSSAGAWGDTENFDWPPRGNEIYQTGTSARTMMKQGLVQGQYQS